MTTRQPACSPFDSLLHEAADPACYRIGLDTRYNRHNRSFAQIENSGFFLSGNLWDSSDSAGCSNFEDSGVTRSTMVRLK